MIDPLLLILGTLVLAIIFKNILPRMYNFYVFRKRINQIDGPGYPIIGIGHIAGKPIDERFWIFSKYFDQFENGMYSAWIGTDAAIHISKPEHIEVILPSTTLIDKSLIYEFLEPWLGRGLLTSTGAKWFHDRKLITPAFHFNILEQFAITMSEKSLIMLDVIENELKKNPGKPIDVFPVAVQCALDTICETAMGINVHAQGDPSKQSEYVKSLTEFSHLTLHRMFRPWLKFDTIFMMTKEGKNYKKAVDTMHNFTNNVIRKRQETRKSQSKKEEADVDDLGRRKRKAFLDLLLDMSDSSANPLTESEIREQVDTFMFAGHDTTGAAITWTLFSLGNCPEIQKRVHDEIDEVFDNNDEPATVQDLAKLKYLDRVIKEVLRLYPSAPIISRRLNEDTKIGDYVLPKDAIISINIIHAHRDGKTWPDPERFDPDRFLPENMKGRSPYAYIPFSAGPRNCIGQKYALLETKSVITAILRKWKVKSVLRPEEIKIYGAFVLRPCAEVEILFNPRK